MTLPSLLSAFLDATARTLTLLLEMTWDTWWALILGFSVSGFIKAFVSEERLSALLGGDSWREVSLATALGTASSSCSYSAVATTKTLIDKGASMAAGVAFLFASTDLVIELGLIIWVLLGWQFVVGEYLGGLIAVFVLAVIFRRVVPRSWIEAARVHLAARHDPTCPACEMAVEPETSVTLRTSGATKHFCGEGCLERYRSEVANPQGGISTAVGWRRAAAASVGEWEMLWDDIALGFVFAALIGGFVPNSWWTTLFGTEAGVASVLAATVIAALIGVVTTMCSVGNVPFALVLWRNSVPFGAVLSFIYADLIIPPILNLYRRHYGTRMATVLACSLFIAAITAGVAVHYLMTGLGMIPEVGATGGTLGGEYTLALNLIFTPILAGQAVLTYGASDIVRRLRAASARTLRLAAFGAAIGGSIARVVLTAVAGVVTLALVGVLGAYACRVVLGVLVDEGRRIGATVRAVDGSIGERARALLGATWLGLGRAKRRSVVRVVVALDAASISGSGADAGRGSRFGSLANVVNLVRVTVGVARALVVG